MWSAGHVELTSMCGMFEVVGVAKAALIAGVAAAAFAAVIFGPVLLMV